MSVIGGLLGTIILEVPMWKLFALFSGLVSSVHYFALSNIVNKQNMIFELLSGKKETKKELSSDSESSEHWREFVVMIMFISVVAAILWLAKNT